MPGAPACTSSRFGAHATIPSMNARPTAITSPK
jgi:hypothetical protein